MPKRSKWRPQLTSLRVPHCEWLIIFGINFVSKYRSNRLNLKIKRTELLLFHSLYSLYVFYSCWPNPKTITFINHSIRRKMEFNLNKYDLFNPMWFRIKYQKTYLIGLVFKFIIGVLVYSCWSSTNPISRIILLFPVKSNPLTI